MKTIKLFALAMLISTTSTFASDFNIPTIKKEEVRVQILELLNDSKPDVATDASIKITFTFSSEGEIVVLNVDSKNSNVLNYIRKNINYKKIENPGKKDEIYIMPLKFKSA
jgi:hypothetical protein